MANSTVGVRADANPTNLVDNSRLTVGGNTVDRQRVDVVPSGTSEYSAGIAGTVNVASGKEVRAIACHSTVGGTVVIAGGDSIPVIARSQFSDSFVDAPIPGPCTVVFTNTDSYYVRVAPLIS